MTNLYILGEVVSNVMIKAHLSWNRLTLEQFLFWTKCGTSHIYFGVLAKKA